MSKLVRAMKQELQSAPDSRTENGAPTYASTLDAVVDLFYLMGASRGNNITHQFATAFRQEPDLAVRSLLYLRDAREGVGERQQYRNLVKDLALLLKREDLACRVIFRAPALGRWDDVVEVYEFACDHKMSALQEQCLSMIRSGLLVDKSGLCAKWMPRKGKAARLIHEGLRLEPKAYRKLIVGLTEVVEQQMCAGKWTEINYNHVPSVAAKQYQKAFGRHDSDGYGMYLSALEKGAEGVKINASAIFPHDVIQGLRHGNPSAANAQWAALPDYIGENNKPALVVVDVSGSMSSQITGSRVSAMDVALGVGMYMSERLAPPFKDVVVTFSQRPSLITLKGSLQERVRQMQAMDWGMNTNLQAVFDLVLKSAVSNKISSDEMPGTIIIVSDMEFDSCAGHGTNYQAIEQKFSSAGYTMPKIVFWNVMARNKSNAPVRADAKHVALISGFSPAVAKAALSFTAVTPKDVVVEALLNPRYDY